MSNATIIHGDCLEELRKLAPGSVDAIITDPPYGIDYVSKQRTRASGWTRAIVGDKAPSIWFLPEAFRVLKPGSGILVFCRWDVAEAFRLGIELAGFRVRSQIVWDREVHGMGDCSAQFAPSHDLIWFATKGKFSFPNGRPKSVIRAMRVPGHEMIHPTEKPVQLLRQLVVAITAPGGTVLDPFAGSGSTGTAALAEGRHYVGIEIDEGHVARSRARLGLTGDHGTVHGKEQAFREALPRTSSSG